MKLNLFSKLIFTAFLAFTLSTFLYFSFGNIYSSKILNYNDFSAQFTSGIYQYRILNSYFLLWIYEFLSGLNLDYNLFKFKFLKAESEPQMYLSFYILNTFFLVLSSVMMTLITETKNFLGTQTEKILLISVAVFVMVFSQFVIVPYDIPSYFFLLLFYFFFLKYLENRSTTTLILLALIILISTFNRETSALSLALAATLLYSKFGLKKETLLPIAVLGITFLAVYVGLRIFNDGITTNDGNLLTENFTQPKNLLGLFFWMVLFVLSLILAKDRKSMQLILLFHLLSVPYIMMCLYAGIMYEIRLYIPLFLTSLLLGRTEISKFNKLT